MFHTFNFNRAAPLAPEARFTSTLMRDRLSDNTLMILHHREKMRRKIEYYASFISNLTEF